MLNVLVYALPNISGGGYSVVLNLYEDIKNHQKEYSDIHWFFITGVEGFKNTDNITVFNESWALKSYIHRYYFNLIKVKEFINKYNIMAVISLNMGVSGCTVPSIISFHNVLPLYRCNSSVFDKKIDIFKQAVINYLIVKSLKHATYIIIPSNWIKRELISKFGISEHRIIISPIIVSEMMTLQKEYKGNVQQLKDNRVVQFIYPASGYPYKNHEVIINAVKQLKNAGIVNFHVRFAGNVGNGKTIRRLKEEIKKYDLPIVFCGSLTKDELVEAYTNGVLLFPSKIETDGFPLLESMACGGFIIASNLDYAKEALNNYDNYELFDPDNSDELEELMRKVIIHDQVGLSKNTSFMDVKPRSEIIVPLLREIPINICK